MTSRRTLLLAATAVATLAALPASAQQELNFGIISTESQATSKPNWTPFLADMEKATGAKINAFFAPDYAGIIEAMRFNKVQIAWYGNASAIQAVDRAQGEVFVQSTYRTGDRGYHSVLHMHKDSPINNLQDVIAASGKLTFGNGDPNSTSGFLIPSYYAWAQNNIDVRKHFTRVVSGNHEANMLAVASKQVDIATGNTEDLERFKKSQPERFAQLKVIWQSPLIPFDPIVWRSDLPEPMKQKVKAFFLDYGHAKAGKSEADAKREVEVLDKLVWGHFRDSSNKQLIPIREVGLFRDRLKIEQDDKMSAEEKASKIKEIDQKLADLKKQAGV